jgi:hypothetical protein
MSSEIITYLICNLLDKSEVVTNENYSALKVVNRFSQGIDGFQIKMISRFVKKQEMRLLP